MSLLRYFVQLLSLSATTLAVTSEEASLIAWKAYGDLIKTYITANQPLTPGMDFIYVSPPTSNFVRGGTPCPESVTNFELYNVVNPLQNSSSGLLSTDGPSYHQSLENYLSSAAPDPRKLTAAEQKQLDAYEAAVTTAKTKFQRQKNLAFISWTTDEVAKYFNQTFPSWVTDNDPQYANYQAQLVTADATYNNYMLKLYGTKYNVIQEQRANINNKAQSELGSVPGYNMMVYPAADNYAVNLNPFVKNEITDFVTYRPAYTLGGYENVADSYFKGTSGFTQLSYSFQNVDGHDWSSLGYEKRVTKYGGGFWGILGARRTAESEITYYNNWSGNFATEVKITLTMKGAPTLVPINTGFWDVGNVRRVYPTLRAKETDELAGFNRLTHALVAYQIGMQITFSNKETWRNVSQFIETGRRNVGGGLNIFGFSFGASGGGAYSHSWDDLKTNTTAEGGVITIPTTPEGMIFLLGARGKAL